MWRSIGPPAGTVSATPPSATPRITLAVVDLEPDGDPPKGLAIGPDQAGNMLEVIVLVLAEERLLAIHAMPLRPSFFDLLPGRGDL